MVAGPDPDPLRGFLSGTLTDLRAQAWAELSVTSQKISPSLSDSELLKAGLQPPCSVHAALVAARGSLSLVRREPAAGRGRSRCSRMTRCSPAAGRIRTNAHLGGNPVASRVPGVTGSWTRVHSRREHRARPGRRIPAGASRGAGRGWAAGAQGLPLHRPRFTPPRHGRLSANRTTPFYRS